MSAKDAVKAREQSKRRPVVVPIEQSIHKRKPSKAAVEPVEVIAEPIVEEVEETVDEAEELVETEAEDS